MSNSSPDTTHSSKLRLIEGSLTSKKDMKEEEKLGFPNLEDQKKLFGHYYVQSFDHRQAAVEAGFKAGQGLHILREPMVSAFVSMLKREYFERIDIDSDFVRAQWLEALPILAGKEEANRLMRDGEVVKAKNFDGPALVSALKELGKMTDTYSEGSGQGGVSVSINLGGLGLTPEQQSSVTIEGEYSDEDGDGAPV